jgi:hypothetical protein
MVINRGARLTFRSEHRPLQAPLVRARQIREGAACARSAHLDANSRHRGRSRSLGHVAVRWRLVGIIPGRWRLLYFCAVRASGPPGQAAVQASDFQEAWLVQVSPSQTD